MIPSDKIKFIAEKLAILSVGKYRLGAVIYDGKTFVGVGNNQPNKTHPKSPSPWFSIHAEFDALLHANRVIKSLRGPSIYVHRIRKDGTPGLAKPCKYCATMLSWAGITDIHYSK